MLFIQFLSPILFAQEGEVYSIVDRITLFGNCRNQETYEKFLSYHKEAQTRSLKNIERFLN